MAASLLIKEELAAIAVSFSAISIFSFGTYHRVRLQHHRKDNQTDAFTKREAHILQLAEENNGYGYNIQLFLIISLTIKGTNKVVKQASLFTIQIVKSSKKESTFRCPP